MTDSQKTIRLVEDNEDDIALTLRAFADVNIGDRVIVARDGAEALALLFGRPGEAATTMPAVVLLDLNVPKINGLEVLQQIRSRPFTRLLPVVVLTSSSEERDLVQSYALGASSFVQKPVSAREFVEAARQLGLHWMDLAQRST